MRQQLGTGPLIELGRLIAVAATVDRAVVRLAALSWELG
jgi:hypothetical protein